MYDLKKIEYKINIDKGIAFDAFDGAWFNWLYMPEGYDYWANVYTTNPIPRDGAAKLKAMREQYDREQRPAVGVLHNHDGSIDSPIPECVDYTWWSDLYEFEGSKVVGNNKINIWIAITQYLVHSYPEPKRIDGTVEVIDGKPDFSTWKEVTWIKCNKKSEWP